MASSSEWDRVRRAASAIRKRARVTGLPEVGVVLGSGLASAAPLQRLEVSIPYGRIPGFPRVRVEGHAGRLRLGRVGERRVAVLEGRAHLYEGHSFEDVVRPLRALISLGAETLIITNAAGGIRPTFKAGDIMGIRDHLNLQGTGPTGKIDPRLGPQFIPMGDAYDPALLKRAASVARRSRIPFRQGVYAGVRGPAYETPAEIEMLRTLGADAVGMSTVAEVIGARQMGARCLGLSLIANAASGHRAGKVTHDEVLAAGTRHAARLGRLISLIIQGL